MAHVQRYFPRRTEVRDEWIELSDGVLLFAHIVLPVDAASDPVPALLEYLPDQPQIGFMQESLRWWDHRLKDAPGAGCPRRHGPRRGSRPWALPA